MVLGAVVGSVAAIGAGLAAIGAGIGIGQIGKGAVEGGTVSALASAYGHLGLGNMVTKGEAQGPEAETLRE